MTEIVNIPKLIHKSSLNIIADPTIFHDSINNGYNNVNITAANIIITISIPSIELFLCKSKNIPIKKNNIKMQVEISYIPYTNNQVFSENIGEDDVFGNSKLEHSNVIPNGRRINI